MNSRKPFYIFLLGAILVFASKAQLGAQAKYSVEVEVGAQGVLGSKVTYQKVNPGFGLYVEGRLNLPNTGFDVGFHASTSSIARTEDSYSYDTKLYPLLLFVSDYNFMISGKVTPFAGIGIGACDCWYDYLETDGFRESPYVSSVDSFHFAVSPRIGVELFKHLRLSVDYTYTGNRLSNFMRFNLGVVFGGGGRH